MKPRSVSDAKADAVKFQIFKAEKLYSKNTPNISSLKDQNVFELIRNIETPREWIGELADYCRDSNIIFLATPFDFEAVDILNEYSLAFKVASFEIVDLELIKYASQKGKPMIMSTGMATQSEIEDAVKTVNETGNPDVVLLHCTSMYPSPEEIINLKVIKTMKNVFDVPIGFSDHTTGIHIPLAAVVTGACIIEKHYTLDRTMKGPDHSFALEPNELKNMVSNIRDYESAQGDGEIKGPSDLEREEVFHIGRRSIHAKTTIKKGEMITRNMLIVKRPSYGISPKSIDELVGHIAKEEIKEDQWITWGMVKKKHS